MSVRSSKLTACGLDLSFKHHAEVASLPPDEADALLDWCEDGLLLAESIQN